MPRTKKAVEASETIEKSEVKETKSKKVDLFSTCGRRKSAVARVFLYSEKGDFTVNGLPINDYFISEKQKTGWLRPFHTVGVSHPGTVYSATIKVAGSGKNSQFDAVVLGLSRALVESNAEFRPLLRKQGLLTRDSREVERKKPFLRKARKAPQYSKR